MIDPSHGRRSAALASAAPRRARRSAWRSIVHFAARASAAVRAASRLAKYGFIIRRSGLFDAKHYRAQCPGDGLAHRAPVLHYLLRGAAAGLDPNPFFDTSYYVEQYPDVAASGKNPFVHFLRRGALERRPPSARFEVADVLARHRDQRAGRGAPGATESSGAEPGRPILASGRMTRTMRAGLERVVDFADAALARRVLVVDQRIPTPDRDSASLRMFSILKLLRRLGHEVTFVSDSRRARWRDARAVRQLGVEVLLGPDAAARHLAARGHEYGAALLSSPHAAERHLMPVRAYALRAKVVYDTVDLHWVRLERGAALTGDAVSAAEAARYRRLERLNAAAADLTLTVTGKDREALLREVPDARVEVLPNIHACPGTSAPFGARQGLMFIGAFSHAPNVDAVEWFADQVLPLVHRRLPGLPFRLVGGGAPKRVKRLASASVEVLGHVREVAPIFDSSRVFVSPLRFGAGMKGKIGQSMGLGLPVVTTAIGAEGMMLVDGEHALLADDAAAFADAVVRLASDEPLWTRLSRSGLQHVEKHFSEVAALARLAALFATQSANTPARAEAVPAVARIRP